MKGSATCNASHNPELILNNFRDAPGPACGPPAAGAVPAEAGLRRQKNCHFSQPARLRIFPALQVRLQRRWLQVQAARDRTKIYFEVQVRPARHFQLQSWRVRVYLAARLASEPETLLHLSLGWQR